MIAPDLLEEIARRAPDSSAPVKRVSRVSEAVSERRLRPPTREEWLAVAPLLSGDATTARLVRWPRLVAWLARRVRDEDEKPARAFERELRLRTQHLAPADAAGLDRVLRTYRQREMNRIALRDLARRAGVRASTRELSHLADALFGAALAFHDRALGARGGGPFGEEFCILAMGKHGAQELNYSSDVDVLFLFRGGDDARRERAALLARLVMRSMSQATEHGFAFRVDANLRPYGRDGALVSSLDELERYYERAGETWERAALIKARPCAGGIDLGSELVERLRPFVWRRSLDLAAVEAIAAMKRRIDSARAAFAEDNVKLGKGGIREIEFFVQALQLLHGGRVPPLRVRGTLDALDVLVLTGLIEAADRDALGDAYAFLRDVEHRLQLPQDRQTQALPDPLDRDAWRTLARSMGFEDPRVFRAELARHREAVHSRFAALLATASDEAPGPVAIEVALARELPPERREEALSGLGFVAPEESRAELDRLARQPGGVFGPRTNERHPGLARRVLRAIVGSPAPDVALARFARLGPPKWEPAALASMLAGNAALTRLVVHLLSQSEALANELRLHPEGLESLVLRSSGALPVSAEALAESARSRLAQVESIEEKSAILRRIRHEETLRIGMLDLAGSLDAGEVGRQLAMLAEVLVGQAFELARDELGVKFGLPPGARLGVLALGSFGGEELGYESDLDLVFVHDVNEPAPGGERPAIAGAEWASRVFQRFLSLLTLPTAEGALYRVDSRLRPSGSQGPLVASVDAMRRYHLPPDGEARTAALWERQALLRARFVTGDASLRADVEQLLSDVVARALPADAGAQIAEMRRKLDVPATPVRLDPKKGPGGILDVEFAAQYLLLVHHRHEPNTRRALEWLGATGALDRPSRDELARAYAFLRRVESRLRLAFSRPDVFVPTGGDGLVRLARQLGDSGPGAGPRLLGEIERTMRRTRALFETLVR